VLWFERRITESALALHLHSYLWWILLVLASARFYIRRLPRRAALLATAIFALAPCHVIPLAWLANREALLSLTFGILALDEATRTDSANATKRVFLTVLLWTLALLSGEYALGMLGYFGLSWLFALQKNTRVQVCLRGLAFALPALAYLGVRKALGYGTHGSAFYSDPSDNLHVYLVTAPRRIVTLALDAFWSLDRFALNLESSWYLLAGSVAASVYFTAPLVTSRCFARLDSRCSGRALTARCWMCLVWSCTTPGRPDRLRVARAYDDASEGTDRSVYDGTGVLVFGSGACADHCADAVARI
jgi:hypothetical protein